MTSNLTTPIAKQWQIERTINALVANGNGTKLAATCADGTGIILDCETSGEVTRVELHAGTSLSLVADCDGEHFLSGGDDGRMVMFGTGADVKVIAEEKKWIDHVAASPSSEKRAYACGKNVQLIDENGEKFGPALTHPSSVGGLGFSPNGKRLSAAHYNGISLWWTSSTEAQKPVVMEWKGSHLSTLWSPDGKIVMTTMQENSLHGWRLADMNEMRMQGYVGKIHSWGFTPKGKYLATSGADVVICWPYFGGGPWGKAPLTLGEERGVIVSQVAPHPKDELLAAGYQDGMIIMAPLDGRAALMLHPPIAETGSEVTGLVWNTDGSQLYAALSSGYIMLFTLDSVARAVKNEGDALKAAGLATKQKR